MKAFGKLLLIVLPLLLAGCAGTGERGDGTGMDGLDGGPGADATGVRDGAGISGDPLNDPSSPLSRRVIYFELDSSEVTQDGREIISDHAQYLSENSNASMTLEGHTDERGTREYNLALGERRANAVQQLMLIQGASPGQIETISYGEEKPTETGHSELVWELNRRAEIVYAGR